MLFRVGTRLATGALTLLLVTALVFGLIQLAPGTPLAGSEDQMQPLSPADRAALEAYYGFDRPLPVQYLSWLGRLARGELGQSIRDRRPVADKIAERLPVTLSLNALALTLILVLAVPIGVSVIGNLIGNLDTVLERGQGHGVAARAIADVESAPGRGS